MSNNPDSTVTVYTVYVAGIGTVYIGSDESEVARLVRKYQDLLKMEVTVEQSKTK